VPVPTERPGARANPVCHWPRPVARACTSHTPQNAVEQDGRNLYIQDMTGATLQSMFYWICMGIAATVTMDLLASVSRKIGLTVGAKGAWVGRWYLGMTRGQLTYPNIADAPEQAGEKRAALIGHYLIGIVLAVFYVFGAGWLGVSPSSLLVALVYGFVTCIFPWFLTFPAFGFGFLGLKAPPESRLLFTSIMNHLYYGLGLWWIAELLPLG
jgi:hypothetical protein